MGYISGNTYNFEVFLTQKGVEAFINGGLKDRITKFTVSDAEADYRIYEDLTYTYDGTSNGLYRDVSGATISIPNKKVTDIGGTTNKKYVNYVGRVTEKYIKDDDENIITINGLKLTSYSDNFQNVYNMVRKSNRNNLRDIVLQSPDLQTTVSYDLLSYKVSENKKYFNLTSSGQVKRPIVLGGRNMWRTGLPVNEYLTFDSNTDPDKLVYQNYLEPVYYKFGDSETSTVGYPGVSVTDKNLSKTEVQSFHIFNKSRSTLYFDSINLVNIKPNTHIVKSITTKSIAGGKKTKITYTLEWQALNGVKYEDGELYLIIDNRLLNNDTNLILPFENYEFFVGYNVLKPGSKVAHYRGQTIGDPNATEGMLQFRFEFITYNNRFARNNENLFTESVDIIVQTKDTGFNSTTYLDSGLYNQESSTTQTVGLTNNTINEVTGSTAGFETVR